MMINLHFVVSRTAIRTLTRLYWLIFMVLATASCKKVEDISLENLYGRWDIHKAERNGAETSYLRNGYFIFNETGTMTINVTGEDESGSYMLEGNKLLMAGERTFDIKSIGNDSLVIKYVPSSNAEFMFYMLKKKDDDQ